MCVCTCKKVHKLFNDLFGVKLETVNLFENVQIHGMLVNKLLISLLFFFLLIFNLLLDFTEIYILLKCIGMFEFFGNVHKHSCNSLKIKNFFVHSLLKVCYYLPKCENKLNNMHNMRKGSCK